MRRVQLPDDLEAVTTVAQEDDPAATGIDSGSVARIWKSALELYRSGVHPAVQVCVRRNGLVVMDRAIGQLRKHLASKGLRENTLLFYCGDNGTSDDSALGAPHRGVKSTMYEGGILVPGLIEWPAKIRSPRVTHFRGSTVDLLPTICAIAGQPLPDRILDGVNLTPVLEGKQDAREADREFILEALSGAKPFAKPGEFLAYHAVSGGFILAEVVHRATGKDIRTVLEEEIREPLGFRWNDYGVKPSDVPAVALNYVTGPPTAPPFSRPYP